MGDVAIRVIQAFKKADLDGNGVISKEELAEVLHILAPGKWDDTKISKLVDAIDTNGDGVIQYEEFVLFLFDKSTNYAFGKAKRHLCPKGDGSMKIVHRAKINEKEEGEKEEEEEDEDLVSGDGYGRILIFFDVDGVLNSTGNYGSSDEELVVGDSDGLGDSDGEQPVARTRTLTDKQGRWGTRLGMKHFWMVRRLLDSFVEPRPAKEKEKGENEKEEEAKAGKKAKHPREEVRPKDTRARLVMTSTWRLSEDQTNFVKKGLYKVGISLDLLLGGTADVSGATRGQEIMHYIGEMAAAGKDVAAWIAIDSDPDSLAALPEEHQVQTLEVDGFDASMAARARAMLMEQDGQWHSTRELPDPGYTADFTFEKRRKPAPSGTASSSAGVAGIASSVVHQRSKKKAGRRQSLAEEVEEAAEAILRRRRSITERRTPSPSPDGRPGSSEDHVRKARTEGAERSASKQTRRRSMLASLDSQSSAAEAREDAPARARRRSLTVEEAITDGPRSAVPKRRQSVGALPARSSHRAPSRGGDGEAAAAARAKVANPRLNLEVPSHAQDSRPNSSSSTRQRSKQRPATASPLARSA